MFEHYDIAIHFHILEAAVNTDLYLAPRTEKLLTAIEKPRGIEPHYSACSRVF